MNTVALVIGQLTHGGAEKQLYELAVRLSGQGFHPNVLCLSQDEEPYGRLLREAGVHVHCLPRRRSFEVRRLWSLSQKLRELRPSIVHAFLFIGNAYGYFAARLANTPAFLPSVRSFEFDRPTRLKWIDRVVLSRAKLVLVNAPYLRRQVSSAYKVDTSRIRVVPNGLDLRRFEEIPALGAERRRPATVGSVSLFKPEKRLPFLLEVARRVRTRLTDVRFVLVGDGPERPALLEQRDRMGLSAVVEMPGRTDRVPDVLAGFDVFILASEREGMPNAVLEAMAAGRPVVASDVVGIRDVVRHGETGFLFPAEDPDAAAQQVVRLLDNPVEAAAMGLAGKNTATQAYAADTMVERTVALYRELLDTGGSRVEERRDHP